MDVISATPLAIDIAVKDMRAVVHLEIKASAKLRGVHWLALYF